MATIQFRVVWAWECLEAATREAGVPLQSIFIAEVRFQLFFICSTV